jgi:hypothetical protein
MLAPTRERGNEKKLAQVIAANALHSGSFPVIVIAAQAAIQLFALGFAFKTGDLLSQV